MANPSMHEQAGSGSPGAGLSEFAGSIQGDTPQIGHAHPRVPDAIERRYLKVDDRYFFPDRTLAFIDDGSRIRVRTENREVMHSVIAIAEARGWRVIELRGTEAFRQGMWREAALRGIEAQGYAPIEAEFRQAERARNRNQPVEASVDRDGAREPRSRRDGPRPPINGVLVAAAAAPYQFHPEQRMSFYVTVRTEVGERMIWGADLERALAESASQPRIGDAIVLTQHGTHPVNLRVPARNDAGELIGERKIVAQRARWRIETPEHLRELQRQARLLRTGEILAAASLDNSPTLATAAAGLKLAEQYARRVTVDGPSQERLVEAIRERMAAAVEQGHTLHLPERKMRPSQRQVRQRGGRRREEPIHERS
ncbi:LPD7 domain-containing protein [Xenophilus sp. Marseille-Q4582]|uniref:LPD7 domain-containing protein n=1 Tax=Xenophilus sp. Marseille-Q4582 TaxID=2866600 RepID=UPI001CE42948|nr:LPD7 domain-containing protein [Xenophilus sp. Marseille-Q4582]